MSDAKLNTLVVSDDQLITLIQALQDELGLCPLKEQRLKTRTLLDSLRDIIKKKHII